MSIVLTHEDRDIILGRWAYDARYLGVGTVNMSKREHERTVGDMENSQGIVGCVKHRINLVHSNDRATSICGHCDCDEFFCPHHNPTVY